MSNTLIVKTFWRSDPCLCLCLVFLLVLGGSIGSARAAVYTLSPGSDLVGAPRTVTARHEDTLLDIARRNNLGYEEIRRANPDVDVWLPGEGTPLVLPTVHLLPNGPREGIVLNTAEMRLYYFPAPTAGQPTRVITHPVSIGRGEWETPLASTKVTAKTADPAWVPPASIRAEHAADGRPLPERVPPGPDNPLGSHALRLGLPSYLIHGTNRPAGIGMQVTHGCIRMYPEDIEQFYHDVPVGTPVHMVYQPYKAGWHEGTLYMEVHPHLDGREPDATAMVRAVVAATPDKPHMVIDWERVRALARERSGRPEPIGRVPPP